VVKEVKHKKIFCGWISGEVCKISDVEIYNARIEKASNKMDAQKWNDQLLSLKTEKSSLESMHPKINLVHYFLHSINKRLWIGCTTCKCY
jgi:hypothetical protein